jgi:hypothetical protein
MPTRSGDPTAELLALLREHCPEVAEETLARLATAAVALGGADGAGGAAGTAGGTAEEARLRWSRLTLGGIPEVEQLVAAASAPVEVIAAVLEFVAGILDVISALLIAIPDPLRALILAAYQILKEIVDDLLSSGAYVYFDAPGLLSNIATLTELGMAEPELPRWVAGDKPPAPDRPADSFQQWAYRFRQSFDDAGDLDRPTFSDGAPVEALFIVATAPQLPDLAALGPLLATLFDLQAFGKAWEDFAATFPEWPDDPDRYRLRASSVSPDWRAWKLRDVGPPDYPFRYLEKLPELLKALLLNVDDVIALIKALVKAVRDKIDVLREIVKVLQQIIDMLKALTATGLHALVVVTDEGVDGLVKAFLEAEHRPNTDKDGNVLTANSVLGVCLLAGTSEVVPANALPVWALFGQQRSMDQAWSGLTHDWDSLKATAKDTAKDTAALAGTAWQGMENGGDTPADLGIEGLWGKLTDTSAAKYRQERDAVLGLLGMSEGEADEHARANRAELVARLEQATAEGARLDPVVLAHLEVTRRARRRGRRSLATAYGPRPPQAPADGGEAT